MNLDPETSQITLKTWQPQSVIDFKMATGSSSFPSNSRPFEIDGNIEAIDTLSLDFGRFETVNRWKEMPECDEFVGAR